MVERSLKATHSVRVPIHKSYERHIISNYRLISIYLVFFPKILEKTEYLPGSTKHSFNYYLLVSLVFFRGNLYF